MLDLDEWREAKKYTNDLNMNLSYKGCGKCAIGRDEVVAGYLYPGNNYIEINSGSAIDEHGRYTLTMSNWSQSSNDLAYLESELYYSEYAGGMS